VLTAPFFNDDYQQIAMLHGQFVIDRPGWDLFWFSGRTESERRALLDEGFHPWWTAKEHRIAMFRPLASALIALDDALFGQRAWLWHAHSLLWFAALIAATGMLLFRLLPPPIAACALLLFAVDEAHNVPVAWIANRSTLIAATFGVSALWFHVRAREQGARGAGVAACLGFALALLAGEYAFGLLAYLLAYECFRAPGGLRARVRALAPAGAAAALYLGVRAALGYGVRASALYVGPDQPLRFLAHAVTRVPVALADLVLGVPSEYWDTGSPWRNWLLAHEFFSPKAWHALPSWQVLHVAIGVFAITLGVLAFRALTRAAPEATRNLGWLLAGSVLSCVVAAGATPSGRLLVAPEIGASALLAALLVQSVRALSVRGGAPRAAYVLGGVAILFVHGALAAGNARSDSMYDAQHATDTLRWALAAEIPARAGDVDVVLIGASDFATAAHVPWLRLAHGRDLPRSYRRLSGALAAHDLDRIDAHTLELRVLSSDVSGAFAGSLYRTAEQWLRAGDHVHLPGLDVEVLAADQGNPWRMRFRFERELEDPHLLFLQARIDGLHRLTLPPVGGSVRLPRAAVPWHVVGP
jgi:hypothetical protein